MTTDDLPLFNHLTVAHNGTEPSMDAATAIKPCVTRLHRLVIDTYAAADDGLTCKELEDRTGLKHQTASARVNELSKCQPPILVFKTDPTTGKPRRRKTGPRSSGNVYFLAEPSDA